MNIKQQGFYIEVSYKDIAFMWGYADEKFIHLMRGDVVEDHKQKGIMTKMVKAVQEIYPDAELSFHKLNCQGLPFVLKSFPRSKIRVFNGEKWVKKIMISYVEEISKKSKTFSKDNPCG